MPSLLVSQRQFWESNFIYYTSIVVPVSFNLLVFYFLFYEVEGNQINSSAELALFIAKLFWLTGAVVAVSNIIGLVVFGNPRHNNNQAVESFVSSGWPKARLIVVYVSRGDNAQALARSIASTEILLQKMNVHHRIDVVTDMPVAEFISGPDSAVRFHLVPEGYVTLNQAKWKARALHYVVEQHQQDDDLFDTDHTWVLHLDEESQMTESVVAGIGEFISNPENQNKIGQGEIKYNAHQYGSHLLITWADSIRSGDDLGRFRFQYSLFRRPLFGMHGSFILAPLRIEQQFGFDLGGKGSVTEDAYFALKCAEQGVKFGWVNGYIREQSPYTILALLKQRRRWFSGLLMLSFDRTIAFKTRLPLLLNTVLWSVAWIGPSVTLITLFFGGYFPVLLLLFAGLLQGFYTATYMVGAARNLADSDVTMSFSRQAVIYLGSLVSVQVVNVIEGCAVLYALISPVKTFDVVNKN
ncbi:glycosyltransferase family 2 protein [Patescibacteria group bacterium]|nr:glycosyltransferase family 2 protein [Patescibacteria group bacterium]